jgi:hypothetical protein
MIASWVMTLESGRARRTPLGQGARIFGWLEGKSVVPLAPMLSDYCTAAL